MFVEYRYHSGIQRQPIGFLRKELILSKDSGSWKVVKVGQINVS